jgi:phage FluMu gp28-like protein
MVKTNIWDTLVSQHVPEEVILRKNSSDLTIYYKNGSIQRFVGCEDIDKHRGNNACDVVFDEYSEIAEEMWTAIMQPVLRENKGTATFIYTPKGKNHSWKLLQMAKEDPEEWFWSVKSVEDTDSIDEKEIEKIRRNTPLALFQQEYQCAFLEGASQFFRRIKDCLYNQDVPLPIEGYFQLGVDLAKYNDWTVITPFNLNTFTVYPQDRFNQVDWKTQESRIEAAARRFNNAKIYIDATGVGDPIVDALSHKNLDISDDTAIKFTEKTRWDLLKNLAILLENGKIKLPNDDGLVAELESFRYELNEANKVKLTVPKNMHDDRVMSLALAVFNVKEPMVEDDFEEFSLYTTKYN